MKANLTEKDKSVYVSVDTILIALTGCCHIFRLSKTDMLNVLVLATYEVKKEFPNDSETKK